MMTEREHTLRSFARCAMTADPQDELSMKGLAISMVAGAAIWAALIALAFFVLDAI
jgi:hypothetical protein